MNAPLTSYPPAHARAHAALSGGMEAAQLARACLHLQARARACQSVDTLAFCMANETVALLPYRQAFVWRQDWMGQWRLATVSGLATLAGDSPLTVWLQRLTSSLSPHGLADAQSDPVLFTADMLPDEDAEAWAEWLPACLLMVPVPAHDPQQPAQVQAGVCRTMVWFALEQEPSAEAVEALRELAEAWGYAEAVLGRPTQGGAGPVLRMLRRRSAWVLAALALIALIPVRMTVLAPAEVVAAQSLAVTAPVDGVIREFLVRPNQPVQAGDRLFLLDDTTLRHRREVTVRQLAVARADAMAAQQKAFADERSKGELAVLNGRVAERMAELAALDEQLGRIEVRAPRAGVAVFGDPDDWLGRPVVTGERIAQIADPDDAGVLVWVPVADAINLEPGARLRLFLHTAPLSPLEAVIEQTSYQAMLSPEGIAAYRVRGAFAAPGHVPPPEVLAQARIGLKGTAKVYGERAPLVYWLLRRPLAALREWTGW